MLSNYIKVAFRQLRLRASYAAINVLGLTVGLVCCTFITLYVLDELSWERTHENAERIVRVVEDNQRLDGSVEHLATTYGPLAPALEADLAVVDDAVRVLPYPMLVFGTERQSFQEDDFFMVDSTFFDVFTFETLEGDPTATIAAPFQVVLTQSTARKYFGSSNAVGQVLQARDDENTHDFTVGAVIADPPLNTQLQFDLLAAWSTMYTLYGTWIEDPRNWDHPPLYTYASLAAGATVEDVEAQLPALALRHMGEERTATRSLHAERLLDSRLRSNRADDLMAGSDIAYVYLFGVIAVFILLLACINFTNLATAQAATRSAEVGARKALGAARSDLVSQFLAETMIMVTVSLGMVVVLVELTLPWFNTVSGKAIESGVFLHWWIPGILALIVAVVGLIAGGYPAFYLSRMRPSRALRSGNGKPSVGRFRQGLVVFQFVVSIALMVGTVVVKRQLDFVRSERLGFDKEAVVIAPLRDLENQFHPESLLNSWTRLPGVEYATASSGMPGLSGGMYDFVVRPKNATTDSLTLMVLTVDHDYVETYGLELLAGRDFSREFPGDAQRGYLINESAARTMGWPVDEAVGQELSMGVWFNGHLNKEGEVLGVVRDFQYHSLHQPIDPIIFHIFPETYYYDYVSARLIPGSIETTLASMEEEWRAFNPERPFEYRFLDAQFDRMYRSEARLSALFGVFAALAIAIACLGLFGLAALSAEQRTKEIGVRKVLGASTAGLVGLLSKDLLLLVASAFVVAAPLTFLSLQRWLQGFAYQAGLSWVMFVMVGVASLAVAWLAVGFHAFRAATADPVDSLRYE